MTRIYRYILPHDTGMAPCPEGGFISLATCKPVIRRVAREGDWVLGFRPGSLERGLVLWAGRVSSIMSHGDYQRSHPNRSDAVYRQREDEQYERLQPDYHPSQKEMDRDLSGSVLIFDPTASIYLHGQPVPLPKNLEHLAAAGQGHRVNETRDGDVARLVCWLENHAGTSTMPVAPNGAARKNQIRCGPKKTPRRKDCS